MPSYPTASAPSYNYNNQQQQQMLNYSPRNTYAPTSNYSSSSYSPTSNYASSTYAPKTSLYAPTSTYSPSYSSSSYSPTSNYSSSTYAPKTNLYAPTSNSYSSTYAPVDYSKHYADNSYKQWNTDNSQRQWNIDNSQHYTDKSNHYADYSKYYTDNSKYYADNSKKFSYQNHQSYVDNSYRDNSQYNNTQVFAPNVKYAPRRLTLTDNSQQFYNPSVSINHQAYSSDYGGGTDSYFPNGGTGTYATVTTGYGDGSTYGGAYGGSGYGTGGNGLDLLKQVLPNGLMDPKSFFKSSPLMQGGLQALGGFFNS
jgi:hypothetical protein